MLFSGDDAHETAERDILHFIQQAETEFAYRLVILVFTLRHRQHHITGKDNGDMGAHGIIRNPTVFLHKSQIGFAGFEKDLDVSSFSINTDDFFLGNGNVRTHQYQTVLPFALHLFGTGTVKQVAINDRNIFPFFVSQRLHEAADDLVRKHHREALSVDPCIVQETVDGTF